MRWALLAFLIGGCRSHTPPGEVVGPFSGTTQRFVADAIVLPTFRGDLGDDLNGNQTPDDAFGVATEFLSTYGDLTDATGDMLASGVLRYVVEITSDDPDLREDPTVGVRIVAGDHPPTDEMGATLGDWYGVLTTNRTRTTFHPATGIVDLPLFEYADPLALYAVGLELELTRDGEGWSGRLHGALKLGSYEDTAYRGFQQMVTSNPAEFPQLYSIFDDSPADGEITEQEFLDNSFTRTILAPDVQLFYYDGRFAPNPKNEHPDSLSFSIALHLIPCAEGNCHTPPARSCLDRIRDGDETGVDCGGSCPHRCPG